MDTDELVSYPFELYDRVGRLFNGFLKKSVIGVEPPFFIIRIPEPEDHSIQIITYCILQLSKGLKVIKEKYGIQERSKYYSMIQLDVHRERGNYVFQIIGIEYINPFHILKLLDLVLWCYLTIEQKKQACSEMNQEKMDEVRKETSAQWREIREEFARKINMIPWRMSFYISEHMKCAICGKEAVKKNIWQLQSTTGEWEVETPVCEKHSDRLI